MSFLQNCRYCFNQERLPITYHNFHHKSLVRPKLASISTHKLKSQIFTGRFSNFHLTDFKCNMNYQNIRRKTKVRPIFIPKMLKIAKKYLTTYMDELSTKSQSLFSPRKFTNKLPQFPSQKSGQA